LKILEDIPESHKIALYPRLHGIQQIQHAHLGNGRKYALGHHAEPNAGWTEFVRDVVDGTLIVRL
jgi:hypothetical protein